MSMSDIVTRQIDHELFDHPGRTTTVKYAVRKYRDRPALAVGDRVTIVRFAQVEDQYGPLPRLLVRTASGAERWVDATSLTIADEILGKNR